jgi:adenosine deaminase
MFVYDGELPMSLETSIREMPKVELHVHLEGAILAETLLELASRNGESLPADNVAGLREWYTFRDFPHFVEIYIAISRCIRTAEDVELVARHFLQEQARQNILYSEVTYTAYTHYQHHKLEFRDQIAAINRARTWARRELGVDMGMIIDIARETSPEAGLTVANWVIDAHSDGVIALGLGGYEVGHPPEKFQAAFTRARAAGVPVILHAGETAGPASIWGALGQGSQRIGHGVRCVEDLALVAELRERQVPLEVCPSSNVCLGVVPELAAHQLPQLLAEGLYVTINSDDPPMFNTTLTDEYLRIAATFGYDYAILRQFVQNAAMVTLLPQAEKAALLARL